MKTQTGDLTVNTTYHLVFIQCYNVNSLDYILILYTFRNCNLGSVLFLKESGVFCLGYWCLVWCLLPMLKAVLLYIVLCQYCNTLHLSITLQASLSPKILLTLLDPIQNMSFQPVRMSHCCSRETSQNQGETPELWCFQIQPGFRSSFEVLFPVSSIPNKEIWFKAGLGF